jgi:DNA-binding FadR family transcriptional regulator
VSDPWRQFTPVARRTVSEEVRQRLAASIAGGELRPGARIPSERTLCESFGVARTSVREAIQGLVSLGMIERRANRAYVASTLPDVDVAPTLASPPAQDHRKAHVRQLFEVRRVIEVPMAELAAERATPEERAEIARLARRFRRTMALEAFRALDRDFHWAIGRASHNPMLAELYLKVLDALFGSPEFSSLLGAASNRAAVALIIDESASAHRAIAGAVASGDPVSVVAAVERHLHDVEDRMVAQLV